MGPWVLEITEDPGHEPAMGAALWPQKWQKALQDPVNKKKTPDQKPPLHQGAHEETREENTQTARVQTSRGLLVQGPSAEAPP